MSEQELSISFANEEDVVDPYWINMEVVKEDDEEGMTISEAASLVDALYDITSCSGSADVYNVNDTNETDNDPTPDEFTGTLEQLGISLDVCESALYNEQGDAGGYDVDIKVFRSHPNTEIYKLRVSNGTASTPTKVTETVTHLLEVESATYVTTDNPIMGNAVITWAGFDGPDLHIKGNTIWWEGEISGVLNAEFDTEYDLVHIHVTGELEHSTIVEGSLPTSYTGDGWYSGTVEATEITGEQNIKCSVLAFYHYQYSELILEEPEEQDSVDSETKDAICDALLGNDTSYFGGSTHVVDDDDGPDEETPYDEGCFEWCMRVDCQDLDVVELAACRADCIEECTKWCEQSQKLTEICDCSHEETEFEITRRLKCPSDYEDGQTLPDKIPEVKYVRCNDTDEDVDDSEFYEETCCEPWPFNTNMPRCQKIYSKYGGFGDFEAFEGNDKSNYEQYENVSFVGVGPKEGICGEKTVEQLINNKNCCEDPPPIYIHVDDNPSVIADYSSALIVATGGTSVYEWSVSGEGAYFLLGTAKVNKISTENTSVVLHTDDACGSIVITITDSCQKNASLNIRSIGGQWTTVAYRSWDPYDAAPWHEDVTCTADSPDLSTIDPDSENTEDESTYTDYFSYTRVLITGNTKFTEYAYYTTYWGVEDAPGYICNSSVCGSGRRENPVEPWPPCYGTPPGMKLKDIDWALSDSGVTTCLLWVNNEPCVYECGDSVLIWLDRFGYVTCGTRVVDTMLFIHSRRWEIWEC